MKKFLINLAERVAFFAMAIFCMYIFGVGYSENNFMIMPVAVLGFLGALIINNIQLKTDAFSDGMDAGMDGLKEMLLDSQAIMPTEEEAEEVFNSVINECKENGMDMEANSTVEFMRCEIAERLNVPLDAISLSRIDKMPNKTTFTDKNGNIEVFISQSDEENNNGDEENGDE